MTKIFYINHNIDLPGRKGRSKPTDSTFDIFFLGDPVSYPPLGVPHRNQSVSRRHWGWCKWSGSSNKCLKHPVQLGVKSSLNI